jgi:4-amino-4-deoxy-L-arabinose transferase
MRLGAFLTAAMVFFYYAYKADATRLKVLHLALFGACCGGAFLVKGFLAFAVPCIVIVPFMVWERSTGRLLRLVWVPLAAVILVSAPWAILIHLHEPRFWSYFFWQEHIHRFFAKSAQHAAPFWYFVPVMILTALPWTALMPAASAGFRKKDAGDPLVRFALCWLVFPFLFFSASRGKLMGYVLPCFPPLALLTAMGLLRYLDEGKKALFASGARVLAVIAAALAAAIAVWHLSGIGDVRYGAGEEWKFLLVVAAFLAWAALTWLSASRQGRTARLVIFSAAMLLPMISGHFVIPRAVEEWCAPSLLLERNTARVRPGQPLLACRYSTSSVCWHYKRSDVYLTAGAGELAYGLRFPDAKGRRISAVELQKFIADAPADELVTMVMKNRAFLGLKAKLPEPEYEDSTAGYVFVQYRGGRAR